MEKFEVILKPDTTRNPAFLAVVYSVSIVGDGFKIRAGYTSGIEMAVTMATRAINIRQAFAGLPKCTEDQLLIKISA